MWKDEIKSLCTYLITEQWKIKYLCARHQKKKKDKKNV